MFPLTRRRVLINLLFMLSPFSLICRAFPKNDDEMTGRIFSNSFNGEMITLTNFMTNEEINDVNSPSPLLDHSEALRKALKVSKVIYIPAVKGYYRFKDIDLDDGVWLIGTSKLPYYPKDVKNIVGCGSAIAMSDGGKSIFKFNNNVTLFGLLLFGNAKRNIDGIEFSEKIGSGKVSNLRLLYCGFYSFRVGIGNNNKYIKADVNNCMSAVNIIGVKNLVDSKISGGCINANLKDGVYLGKGANDNIIINVKSEWNKGCNFKLFHSINNIISNSICDRAGKQGILVVNSQIILDSCIFRRNGALINDPEMSSHILVEGDGSSLLVRSIKTLIGKNDDRSGLLSPVHSIIFGGESIHLSAVVSDSDLSGSTSSSIYQKIKPSSLRLNNNIVL